VEDEKTKSGIILIKNQLYDLLRKYGLERLDGGVGKIFNPETDEVIELREDDLEEGKIIKVLTPGYKFYDKILRPARVIVSKGKGQK
jgi:molecular chaperone GrpE